MTAPRATLRETLLPLRDVPRALALVRHAAGWWTFAWAVILVVQGLVPAATVWLTRLLVDQLVADVPKGWPAAGPSLRLLALTAGCLLLGELLRLAGSFVKDAQAQLLRDHIADLIQRKSVEADLAFYELPEYYDRLHRAREEGPYRPVTLLESIGSLVQDAITLAAMAAILIAFSPWLPLALLGSTLPALLVVVSSTLRRHRWRREATPDERRCWYLDWILTSPTTAAEVRVLDLGEHWRSTYSSLRTRIRADLLRLARAQSASELAASTFAVAVAGAAFFWMVRQTFNGAWSLGVLALFLQAFLQGQRLARSLLENAGRTWANSLFLGNLFEFLAMKPAVVSPPDPAPPPDSLHSGVRFIDVTFRYPGSVRAAIEGINLTVPAGGVVAIVGLNGAGKSTLLKLLCRLYDPTSGSITLDNTPLASMDPRALRRRLGVLFQNPVHYDVTAAGNISLGDLDGNPSPDRIATAARQAGATDVIARLPRGFDNVLGKQFPGGTDLSGGEWQRIALARALIRPAPLLLLDEPTSAMDAWAEAEWLRDFRTMTAGRTVLVITHRFTTAMRADTIHVMAEGRVVESGSHDELIAKGGRYAASWREQTHAG